MRSLGIILCVSVSVAASGCDEQTPQVTRAEAAYQALVERAAVLPAYEAGQTQAEYFAAAAATPTLTDHERGVFAAAAGRTRDGALSPDAMLRTADPVGTTLGDIVASGLITETDVETLAAFIADVAQTPFLAGSLGAAYAETERVEALSEPALAMFTAARRTAESLNTEFVAQMAWSSDSDWHLRWTQSGGNDNRPNDIASQCRGVGIDPPPSASMCMDWGQTASSAALASVAGAAGACGWMGGVTCATPAGAGAAAVFGFVSGVAVGGTQIMFTHAQIRQAINGWCRDTRNRSHDEWSELCSRRAY